MSPLPSFRPIESGNHAVDIVSEAIRTHSPSPLLEFCNKPLNSGLHFTFPFGIWFRGQTTSAPVVPRIFRPAKRSKLLSPFDETSLYMHFQVRARDHISGELDDFDWLCLMQHYDLPTRLLDWSESILIALYFAVAEKHDGREIRGNTDGKLIILNAKQLNGCKTNRLSGFPGIYAPMSGHVWLRAIMPLFRTFKHWTSDAMASVRMHTTESMVGYEEYLATIAEHIHAVENKFKIARELKQRYKSICSELSLPVAVFPNRRGGRMTSQFSTFTIHGGKMYQDKPDRSEVRLPAPTSLETLNNKVDEVDKFLITIPVAHGCKEHIRKQLLALGIHEGTLFPEIDKQAKYIAGLWNYNVG